MRMSLDGDFAGALTLLNRLVADLPFSVLPASTAASCWTCSANQELALADYRHALLDRDAVNNWNRDQAALAIWSIRSFQGERAEADEELRRHFAGRKSNLKENWYGWLADFLLDRHADEAALIGDAESVERPTDRPWRLAGAITLSACAVNWLATSPAPGRCWKRL